MESNDEKELDLFLSEDSAPAEQEEEKAVEETPLESPEESQEEKETEEEETPEESQEVEALTEREKALIAQFTETDAAEVEVFDPSVPPSMDWKTQEYQFLKDDESLDDILGDPAKLNAKMAQLYNDALRQGAQMALEATYKGLPRTISTYAKQQIEVTTTVNDFYQQNKDLVPLKPALARIAQKIGAEHPEYSLPQLLSESAKTARTIFKMHKHEEKRSSQSGMMKNSPAFVGQKGGTNRIARPKVSKTLEDEVMELIR